MENTDEKTAGIMAVFSRHESRCLIQARQSQYVDLKHAKACPLLPHFSVNYHIFLELVNRNSCGLPLRWNPFSCGIPDARCTAGLRSSAETLLRRAPREYLFSCGISAAVQEDISFRG